MFNNFSLKDYPWLFDLYKKIIFSGKIKNKNFNLIIHSFYKSNVNNLVLYLSKWILCTNLKFNKCCNSCCNCKLFKKKKNPNFYYLKCKKDLVPNIDDIKRINLNLLNNLSYINLQKVVYISNFNLLSSLCFNSLLKIIEEYPYKIIFIFSCFNMFNIPSTIISRCQYYKIFPPKEKNIIIWLNKYFSLNKNIEVITSIRLSNNSPLLTIYLLKKMWVYRLNFLNKLNNLFNMNFLDILNLLDNNFLNYNLDWLLFLFSDIIKYLLGINKYIVNLDSIVLIDFYSKKISIKNIFVIVNKLFIFIHDLNNVVYINKNIYLYDLSFFLYSKVNNL